MNSNTHNYSLNISTFFTSPIPIYTHLIPYITNSIYNPTIVDFERLIPQYEQYFSIFRTNNKLTQDHELKNNFKQKRSYYYIFAFQLFLNTFTILF